MNLKLKIILLATLPLIFAIAAIAALVKYQTFELSRKEITAFENTMLDSKKAELVHYVSLAQTSIEHLYEQNSGGTDEQQSREQVKRILGGLTYGTDGYFFVYDYQGNNLVHPKQPWRMGKNWWDLTDAEGNLVIQNLIAKAREGGGFHRYLWEKPSLGETADKISYAVALPRWGWMLGTGIYIDDIVNQVEEFKSDVNDRTERVFVVILAIAALAVVAVSATGVAINIREGALANSKLQALTQKIVDVQEEERTRVAQELHDGISQTLASAKFSLEAMCMDPDGNCSQNDVPLQKTIDRLTSAIHEVRRISHDLRPGILDDLGLSAALKNLAEDFADRNNIEIDVSTVAFKSRLHDDVKTALYRVAQEALTNIERHAAATKISLRLSVEKEDVLLQISDNGRGFNTERCSDENRHATGMGLRNIRERILHFNGNVEVNSSQEGSAVIARLPKTILQSSAPCNPAVEA